MSRLQGYNVALKLNGKTCIGRTQEDLSVTPVVKESQTKDDAGNKQSSIVGHDVTFKVSGLMEFDNTSSATKLDSDDLLEQAMKKGAAAEIPVVYERTGGDSYQGTAIMTGYNESTNAEDEGTYTVDLKITGTFAKVTAQAGQEGAV